MKPTKRITGYAGQKIRKRILMRDPLCQHCKAKGLTQVSTQVDHIIPLFKGGEESDSNRQGLCDECHKIKTDKDQGHQSRFRHSYNSSGMPTNKDHPWNR